MQPVTTVTATVTAIDDSASEALRLWCEMMAVGDDSDRVTDIEVDERGERWTHYVNARA